MSKIPPTDRNMCDWEASAHNNGIGNRILGVSHLFCYKQFQSKLKLFSFLSNQVQTQGTAHRTKKRKRISELSHVACCQSHTLAHCQVSDRWRHIVSVSIQEDLWHRILEKGNQAPSSHRQWRHHGEYKKPPENLTRSFTKTYAEFGFLVWTAETDLS